MADLTGRIIGALQADVKTFEEVEADPNAFSQAVTVIVLAGVASLIGNFFRVGIVGGLIHLVASMAEYALFSLLVFLIGTKLMPEPTTKADFNETFRTVGFAAAPGIFAVLAIVPILGVLISFVIWIWSLVIGIIAVRQALDYSNTGRAIIVALIAGVICWAIVVLVFLPLALAAAVTHAALNG